MIDAGDLHEAQDRLREAIEERSRLMKSTPIFAFKPNPPQWRFIENDDSQCLGIIAANKVGKSTIVSVEGIDHSLGFRPFLPSTHAHYRVRMTDGNPIPVPNIGQVVAEDYPNGIGKVQWPMWEKWLPKGSWQVVRTERGVPRELKIDISWCPWADTTSPLYPFSRVHFMAYEQGAKKFAGFDPHWILNDEPCPKDVWIEEMRGLVSAGGKWMAAMTLVNIDQAWVYEIFYPRRQKRREENEPEIEGKTYVVTGEMRDNLKREDGSGGLTEKNIRDYEARLSPNERAVRIYGKRIHMIGTQWGHIFNEEKHRVPHRQPNPHNPRVMGVDPHPTKDWAILFCEVDENDIYYFWAESMCGGTLDDLANEIKEIEQWGRSPTGTWKDGTAKYAPQIRLIDPLAKVQERGPGSSPAQQLSALGLHFQFWRRHDKVSRLRNVTEMLKPGTGPTAAPRIQISEECLELLYEIPLYREKLPQHPETQERKGEMIRVADDMVDAMVGIINGGFTYKSLCGLRDIRSRQRPSSEYEEGELTEAVGGY
jgi:hypothetical protein